MINFRKRGINCAKQLASYSIVLNEDPTEGLGWRYPFQVYYGRRSNRILSRQEGSIHLVQQERVAANTVSIEPSLSDVNAFEERRNKYRQH